MVESIIALGSNVGNREGNLGRALSALGGIGRVTEVSSIYETEPMYIQAQGWFLNCVAALETALSPAALLGALQSIESAMGRERGVKYGPRVIDLDIIFYGSEVVSEDGLEIPHPRVSERRFVLVPLAEIRPGLVHPVLRKTIRELADELGTGGPAVRRIGRVADLGT